MKRIALWLAALGSLFAWAEADHVVLDYVEATGAQWVDTGIVGRTGQKAEIELEWTDLNSDQTLLASRSDASSATRINFLNCSWENMGYGYGNFVPAQCRLDDNKPNDYSAVKWERRRIYRAVTEFTEEKATLNVDGIAVQESAAPGPVDSGCNLTVFGNNVGGSVTGLAYARCHGLKLWQDGALVRDLVPVLKDGRAGFHDAVSQAYFFSASGTDLVAGPSADEPDSYVDFVESSGNEYVDLGVVGRSGLTLESRMSWVTVPNDGSYVASRKGDNTRFYLYHHYQRNTIGHGAYDNSGVLAQAGVVYDVRTVLRSGEQSLTVDGARQISRADAAQVDTGFNLYLFACNKDGAPVYGSSARCYSLKLWDGDTLVRDLRPCLKRGKACLYDQVSGTLLRAGRGTLKAGRDPKPGRPDYFVSYIESQGDNFLDTGVRARSGTRAAGTVQFTQTRSMYAEQRQYLGNPLNHQERTVLGACAADSGKRFYMYHAPNSQLWIGYNELRVYPESEKTNADGTVTLERIWLGTGVHTFETFLDTGTQTAVLDGRQVLDAADGSTVSHGFNLYLFACNRGGSPYFMSNSRCYGLKLWQDDVLVRDFRPCVKDGAAGLYDAVRDEVVFPAFPVPADCVGTPEYTDDMKPAQLLEYVESDGSQWFDTGVVGRSGTVAEFKMAWLYLRDDPDVGFLGSRRDGGDTRFYMWHDAHNSQSFGYMQFTYFNGNDVTSPNWRDDPNHLPVELGRPYEVTSSFLADHQTIVVDGTTRLDIARTGGLDTGCTMYLFAYNNYGTAACQSAARLYGLKISQDGRLVRDFVPVRLDCGLNALWDRVEEKIYTPLSGTITKWGPVIGDYVTPPKGTVLLFR